MTEKIICNYFVAFIDLLGQREKLNKYKVYDLNSFHNDDEKHRFEQYMIETIGTVADFYSSCENYFVGFEKNQNPELHKKYKEAKVIKQHYSDGVVIFITLADCYNEVPMGALFMMLTGCASIIITQLAKKNPIRGGVDIGLGFEYSEGEIYGSALANAYTLESTVAEYPRIVVGGEILEIINTYLGKNERAELDDLNKRIALGCKDLIKIDYDGKLTIDYLGDFYINNIGKQTPEIFKLAYEFVCGEMDKYLKCGNLKLTGRYSLLKKYFDDNKEKWEKLST